MYQGDLEETGSPSHNTVLIPMRFLFRSMFGASEAAEQHPYVFKSSFKFILGTHVYSRLIKFSILS